MKREIDNLDATPHKRVILSIVSDYNLTRSVCELIDNAIDVWIKGGKQRKIAIKLNFDFQQRTIEVSDNAGGVTEDDLVYLISPGATTNKSDDMTIGIFGVGTKRAVIALSQDIKIISRYRNKKTYAIEFDENWLADEDWHLPYYEVDAIEKDTTLVKLQKLRINIEKADIELLAKSLSEVYAYFLKEQNFDILINNKKISPTDFAKWAYPPEYEPRRYHGVLNIDQRSVLIEVIAGLTNESSPAAGEYGVYFYCNDRLICKALKSPEVGFIKGVAGLPHPSISLTRIIVILKGASKDMPWNSSKSNINTDHPTFHEFRSWLLEIVKNFCSLSRRLEGDWPNSVFKYNEGDVIDVQVPTFSSTSKSYLVPLPKVNVKYIDYVKKVNTKVERSKPWTKGLYEAMVVVNSVAKQRLETKNRITLILLDSNLEIAFKEFLVNDSGKHYSDRELLDIFSARHKVHAEIKKYITAITDVEWGKIKYYYDLRCKLIHERATVNITDSQVNELKLIVEKVLKLLFKINL